MKKLCGMGLALFVVLIMVSGCQQKQETELRLGSMPTYSAAIYAVGIEEGFFEEEGVDVSLTIFKSATERDSAAVANELDGFMTDIMGAIKLYEKGYPFKMISSEYEAFAIMAGPASDTGNQTSPTIGISEDTIIEYIVDRYMTQTVEKVQVVALPDRLALLSGEQLAMAVFPEPFIGMAKGLGAREVFSTLDEAFQPVVLVFDQSYIEQHEEEVKAFYRAYEKTISYMQETSYDHYKEALIQQGLATAENVDRFQLPVMAYGLRSVKEEDYLAVTEWLLEKDLLSEAVAFEAINYQLDQ